MSVDNPVGKPYQPSGCNLSQLDKFKELARELEVDEDEAHWDERLKKVAAHRPGVPTSAPPKKAEQE